MLRGCVIALTITCLAMGQAAIAKRDKPSPFEPKVNRDAGIELPPVVVRQSQASRPEAEVTVSGESAPGNSWVSRKPAFTPFVDTEAPVASRGARRNNEAVPQVVVVPVAPPPPAPLIATAEKLAAIQPGASYATVLAELGPPAARIEMMEDGKLLESLRIESHGTRIGTIRMVNGVVASIEPLAR